jgi:hypothetical protein
MVLNLMTKQSFTTRHNHIAQYIQPGTVMMRGRVVQQRSSPWRNCGCSTDTALQEQWQEKNGSMRDVHLQKLVSAKDGCEKHLRMENETVDRTVSTLHNSHNNL